MCVFVHYKASEESYKSGHLLSTLLGAIERQVVAKKRTSAICPRCCLITIFDFGLGKTSGLLRAHFLSQNIIISFPPSLLPLIPMYPNLLTPKLTSSISLIVCVHAHASKYINKTCLVHAMLLVCTLIT